MLILKQLIPSRICLDCQVCCRFPKKDTLWQARLTKEEAAVFKKQPDFKISIKGGRIKTKSRGRLFCCSFFSPSRNACKIYKLRPFECRTYPFVLTSGKDGISLAAHLVCPFVLENFNSQKFKRYTEYLRRFFSWKSIHNLIKANPRIAQGYKGYKKELLPLFSILYK